MLSCPRGRWPGRRACRRPARPARRRRSGGSRGPRRGRSGRRSRARTRRPATWRTGCGRTSASTSGAMPSARVMRLASGWWAACSSVKSPRSTSSWTIEWSRVIRKTCPPCTRYARLSPTCATSVPSAWIRIATAVEPGRPIATSVVRITWTRRLASSMAVAQPRPAGAVAARASKTSKIVASASSAASRPAACPPIPSQTTHRWPKRVSRWPQASSLTCLSGSRPGSRPLRVLDRRELERGLRSHGGSSTAHASSWTVELDRAEAQRRARRHRRPRARRDPRPATHVPLFESRRAPRAGPLRTAASRARRSRAAR